MSCQPSWWFVSCDYIHYIYMHICFDNLCVHVLSLMQSRRHRIFVLFNVNKSIAVDILCEVCYYIYLFICYNFGNCIFLLNRIIHCILGSQTAIVLSWSCMDQCWYRCGWTDGHKLWYATSKLYTGYDHDCTQLLTGYWTSCHPQRGHKQLKHCT